MPIPSALTSRLQYLDDTLRQRFPGFIDDSTDVTSDTARYHPPRLPAHEPLEQAIGKIIAKRIPEHPAYNTLILHTLRTFRANNVAAMDPAKDRARLMSIILAVHKRRPVFPKSYHRDDFLRLHTLLEDYSEIKGGNLRRFPSIETLGHRRDEAGLRKSDHGQTVERALGKINPRYAADEFREQNIPLPEQDGQEDDGMRRPADEWIDKPEGWMGKQALRRQQLQTLNRHIDTLCPPGSYFNSMRQQLIHRVWSNRQLFRDYKSVHERNEKKGWAEVGYTVKKGRIEETNFVWMPEEKWQPMKEFVSDMEKMLQDARKRLITSTGRYPQPLTPEEAVKVDRLVRNHARLSERHAAGTPTNSALSGHIPEGIKRAVVTPHNPVRANPVARQWAQRCAATIEEIVPFKNRKSLDSRLRLRDLVYSSRRDLLDTTPEADEPAGHTTLTEQGDVSDVSDAEDNGGRVHPLTVADLGEPIRDDKVTQKRFDKLLRAGKIRYAESVSSKYEELTRTYYKQFKDQRHVIERLVRELDSFDNAWTGKLREPPPEMVAAHPAEAAIQKPRKPVAAFQTKKTVSADNELGQQKLFFPQPSLQKLPERGGPEPGQEVAHSLKRKRGDDANVAENEDAPQEPISRANTRPLDENRPAKRGRVEDRPNERQRSLSRE